jgi:CheY-like chemotaxis protein
MGLKGRLEDLPLLDMLQIIAFSRKSGFLRIAATKGRGAVVLREGRVLFSYSWSTLAGLEELVRHPEKVTVPLIREQIEVSLRELGSLREGHFQFELADPTSEEFGGVRIQPFLLPDGLDAQELLLDLAVEIDNERREATSLLELAFQGDLPNEPPSATLGREEKVPTPMEAPPAATAPPPSKPAPSRSVKSPEAASAALPASPVRVTVVVVDDEAPVREVVSEELGKKGYRVFTASNPAAGAGIVQDRAAAGERVMAVVDLKMPTSTERSFFGGFELIRRVHKNHPGIPVLLMTEALLSEKAKLRAKELGIRRLVHKPTLSKIDAALYVQDLRDFASTISEQLGKLQEDRPLEGNGRAVESEPEESGRVDFLASMTKKLVEPGATTDVSRLVMEVAARFLERGVLFVVKGDAARGLAAFGVGRSVRECSEMAQKLTIEVGHNPAFAEAVRRGSAYRLSSELTSLERPMFKAIGRGQAKEAVLIPLLYNRATLLLLYGDNAHSGRALGDLGGLELFIAQAGMALENKLLQRKLSGAETGLVDEPTHDSQDAPNAHA